MKVIVVIPTYNERENLGELIKQIQKSIGDLHILIVDDNSPDGTGEVAEALRKRTPERIFVLHREKKEGIGRAYVEGFQYALRENYEVIVQMDADLSHDPSYLPVFLDQIRSCDLILGSRYIHGISVVNWDLKRLILSRLAIRYVQLIIGLPFTDTTSGFKCWRQETLRGIELERTFSNGYLFQVETTCAAYRKGFKIIEIPIIFIERRQGRSKINLNIIWEAFWGVLRLKLKHRVPRNR